MSNLDAADVTLSKGKEEDLLYEERIHKETVTQKKEGGFLSKLGHFMMGTTVQEEETDTVRIGEPVEIERDLKVIDEKVIAPDQVTEKVLEEKDILAPVEHRKVIEERRPREHIRIIEEVVKLEYPVFAEKDLRKLTETKEVRHPIQRKVVVTEEIRVPVERRQIIEEVWESESVRIVEEKAPIVGGTVEEGMKRTKEVSTEVEGLAMQTNVEGVRSYVGKPTSSTVRDEFEVPGVIGVRKVIEEIEVVEYHRFYEEKEAAEKVVPDADVIRQHHGKKYFKQ